MSIFFIDTRDKPGLLIATMRAFEGGRVSFEGGISQTCLELLPGASTAETPELRRAILGCGEPSRIRRQEQYFPFCCHR